MFVDDGWPLSKLHLIFEPLNRTFESRIAPKSNHEFRRAPQSVRESPRKSRRRGPDRDCNCERRDICLLTDSIGCETEATSMDRRTRGFDPSRRWRRYRRFALSPKTLNHRG